MAVLSLTREVLAVWAPCDHQRFGSTRAISGVQDNKSKGKSQKTKQNTEIYKTTTASAFISVTNSWGC
jgi:hypothetical protein